MLSENINGFDDVKFDTASLMAQLYQQQNQSIMAKPILRKALQMSQHNVYWHCKLLFQLAVSNERLSSCRFTTKNVIILFSIVYLAIACQ